MRAPAIWFDATTLKRFRHESPVGLSRMEAHVLAGALTLDAERVGFCSVNRYDDAMERLARSEVEEATGKLRPILRTSPWPPNITKKPCASLLA